MSSESKNVVTETSQEDVTDGKDETSSNHSSKENVQNGNKTAKK